jgi:TPR repeat protein
MPFGSKRMKRQVLFPLLLILLFAPSSAAAPQTPNSTKDAAPSTFQRSKWTEADRKALLTRAHHGDAGAQSWLGVGYEQGRFGKIDFKEALKWLRKAAAQGDPDAQDMLGQMYEDGEGVRQNYVLAAKWYRKAAEHVSDLGGAGQGRNNLGMLYMDGLGVSKDYVQAYMWFRLTNFESNLSYAKAYMTPAQVLEAERMATEWKRHHPQR